MLKKYAESFYQLGATLTVLKLASSGRLAIVELQEKGVSKEDIDEAYVQANTKAARYLLSRIEGNCADLELSFSLKAAKRLGQTLQKTALIAELKVDLDDLDRRIRDELEERHLIFVSPGKSDLYDAPLTAWGRVPDEFPSAIFDIDEASKCLALDRGTASVFHQMRVLERGLRLLAGDLSVELSYHPNWSEAIDLIEKRVTKQMPPSDPKAKHRQFYQQAVMQFRLFKDAVRNYVTHESATYNSRQSEGCYRAVNDFMQHLATRLSENESP